jgi:hypothetical protein
MACCDGRDRFWAQVKTLGGRPRSGSQLSSTLTDLTLLRIAIFVTALSPMKSLQKARSQTFRPIRPCSVFYGSSYKQL